MLQYPVRVAIDQCCTPFHGLLAPLHLLLQAALLAVPSTNLATHLGGLRQQRLAVCGVAPALAPGRQQCHGHESGHGAVAGVPSVTLAADACNTRARALHAIASHTCKRI